MKSKLLLIALIVFIFTGCKTKKKEDISKDEKIVVSTIKVENSEYSPVLSYSGVVKAYKEANLGAALPGRVEKIFFTEGESVKEGALIAELSGEMLLQAQIENEALKKDYERLERLKEKGSISDMNYDHVKAQYEASQAKVALLKKNTQIKAPFSGIIASINVKEGENFSFIPSGLDMSNLSLASGIVKLIQINPIKIEIEVNEKDLSQINKGQLAEITLDAYPTKSFNGKVRYIKPVLSTSSHTAIVEIELNNNGDMIKPGMYANVSITTPKIKGLIIPASSIIRQEGMGDEYVFVIKENKAQRVNIKKVFSSNDKVVVSGLEEGQDIAVFGKNKLSEGTIVTVKND